MHQRERQVEPALHPARVAAHPAVRGVFEPDALEELIPAALALLAREPVQSRLQVEVLAAGQEGVERSLLQRRPDGGPHLRTLAHDVVAGHPRRAARWRKERRQHQDGRGLPGAVRAEKTVDLPRLDPQVYAIDGPGALPELPDEVLDLYPAVAPHYYAATFRPVRFSLASQSLRRASGSRAISLGSIHFLSE